MLVGWGDVSAVVTFGLAVTWTSGSSTAEGRIDTARVTASAPMVTRSDERGIADAGEGDPVACPTAARGA